MSNPMEQLAQKVGLKLKQLDYKIATAESCTGGGVGFWLTNIPGSSAWYDRGFITYSNAAKMDMLQVTNETLRTHGAVSEQAAREMAEGAIRNSLADISIAITGIAGPDGGTAEKPVGTVWIAYASKHFDTKALLNTFPGNRHEVREETIGMALEKLLQYLP